MKPVPVTMLSGFLGAGEALSGLFNCTPQLQCRQLLSDRLPSLRGSPASLPALVQARPRCCATCYRTPT